MLLSLKSFRKQSGIGLLELMLSLSIIAILLVMATRFYMTANVQQQKANTVSMVSGIMSGAADYATRNNGSYAGMTLLALAQGYGIPGSFCGNGSSAGSCTGNNANPFHGNLDVNPASSGSNYVITLDSFPASQICNDTAAMVNAAIQNTQVSTTGTNATCSGTTMTVTVY